MRRGDVRPQRRFICWVLFFFFFVATLCMTITEGIERDVFFKSHKGPKSAFFIASSSRLFFSSFASLRDISGHWQVRPLRIKRPFKPLLCGFQFLAVAFKRFADGKKTFNFSKLIKLTFWCHVCRLFFVLFCSFFFQSIFLHNEMVPYLRAQK